jgi:hypothetical protein
MYDSGSSDVSNGKISLSIELILYFYSQFTMSANKSFSWPNWPDITDDAITLKYYLEDPDYAAAKQKITQIFSQESIMQGWIKTCTQLVGVAKEVQEKGDGIFPVVEMEDITQGLITPEKLGEIRRIGSFIVRGVIPSSEIEPIFQDLKEYIATNKDEITGYPHENPAIFCVYNSPAQNDLGRPLINIINVLLTQAL